MARLALTLVSLVAAASARTRLCGNNPSAEKVLAHEQHFKSMLDDDASYAAKLPEAPSVVPVHWHVIASGNHSVEGNITFVAPRPSAG